MDQKPVISIITPAYKAALFVGRMIESVQKQTFRDWELIIVDDASGDGTVEVVLGYAENDPRIRLLRQSENSGPSVTRNVGLDASKGQWIALIDADDACAPERLARMLQVAEEKSLDLVADNQLLYDQGADQVVREAFRFRSGLQSVAINTTTFFKFDNTDASIGLGLIKPLIRKSFLSDNNIRFLCRFRSNEDFLFYATCFAYGAKSELIIEPFYIYTQQVGQISAARSTHSRTEPKYKNIIELSDYFEAENRSRLSSRDTEAIRERRSSLVREVEFNKAKVVIREKGYVAGALNFAVKPFLWKRLGRTVLKKKERSRLIYSYE